MVQINFSSLQPLEDFPTKGLLQIFISGDDEVYGYNFDYPQQQSRWAIRYLEEIPKTFTEDQIFLPKANKETFLPFPSNTEYLLVEHRTTQTISITDYRFNDVFSSTCAHLLKEGQKTVWDLDQEVVDLLMEHLKTFACQMHGYPFFTQEDPRDCIMKKDAPELLLFQLDSGNDIMWGDFGVANFFISKQDLQKKDFSNVMYTWDCC